MRRGDAVKRSTRRLLIAAAVAFGLLALANPRYSSVYVDGPAGRIKSEQWRFGLGGLVSYNRVVADRETVTVKMAD